VQAVAILDEHRRSRRALLEHVPRIVTVNVHRLVDPNTEASHVTAVVPCGNCVPDGGTQMTVGGLDPQRFTTWLLQVTRPGNGPEQNPTRFDGQVIATQLWQVPVTVTGNSQRLVWLGAVTLQVTKVVPMGNVLPDGGVQE